jgi:hypothetical protein
LLSVFNKAYAGDNETSTIVSAKVWRGCYDSYESPNIWLDDINKRICTTCDMYYGHDFGDYSQCEADS